MKRKETIVSMTHFSCYSPKLTTKTTMKIPTTTKPKVGTVAQQANLRLS